MACILAYRRADNMWAAEGRPDGNLGEETVSLQAGQIKVFNTDWKYEKQRNDGTHYYGSHLRIATNRGSAGLVSRGDIVLRVRYGPGNEGEKRLALTESWNTKCDLMEVRCVN